MDTEGLAGNVSFSLSYATLSGIERTLEEQVAGSVTLSCVF